MTGGRETGDCPLCDSPGGTVHGPGCPNADPVMPSDTPGTGALTRNSAAIGYIGPTQLPRARRQARPLGSGPGKQPPVTTTTPTVTRSCGCDTDVRVFGHVVCVPDDRLYGKHVICGCSTCTCPCHKDR